MKTINLSLESYPTKISKEPITKLTKLLEEVQIGARMDWNGDVIQNIAFIVDDDTSEEEILALGVAIGHILLC